MTPLVIVLAGWLGFSACLAVVAGVCVVWERRSGRRVVDVLLGDEAERVADEIRGLPEVAHPGVRYAVGRRRQP